MSNGGDLDLELENEEPWEEHYIKVEVEVNIEEFDPLQPAADDGGPPAPPGEHTGSHFLEGESSASVDPEPPAEAEQATKFNASSISIDEYRAALLNLFPPHDPPRPPEGAGDSADTGEKPFKCDQCQYSSTSHGHLNRHKRIHTGEKPFQCTVCEYKCARRGELVIHMRHHTGEKPYKCNFCDFSSTQRKGLKYHMQTHTGDKPYKCDLCEFRFIQRQSLTRHMTTHTGEKPFKCHLCEYRCIQRSNLGRHMRTHLKPPAPPAAPREPPPPRREGLRRSTRRSQARPIDLSVPTVAAPAEPQT